MNNNLNEILKKFDYECLDSDKRISEEDIKIYEKELNTSFGPQLKDYILNYGCIFYSYAEFYSINQELGLESNMITESKYLYSMSDLSKGLIAIEDLGDGDYILVDSNDNTYEFILDDNTLNKLDLNLNNYIKNRLDEIDSYETN